MDIAHQLEQVTLFRGLDMTALKTIAALTSPMDLADGEILIEEGGENRSLYVVLEGGLHISLPDVSTRFSAVRFSDCLPGSFVGEYSVFDGEPASARVVAVGESRVVRIDGAALLEILDTTASIGAVVYRNMIDGLIRRLRKKDAELDLPFDLGR